MDGDVYVDFTTLVKPSFFSLGTPCARELRYALCRKFSYVRTTNCPLTRSVCLSPACLLFVSLRSFPVTAVEFASEGIVASSSTDGSTKFWDLGTGQETEKTPEAVPEGFTFPKQGGAQEQRINSYVVAAKGQTFVIHKAPEDKAPQEKVETAA